MKSASKADAAWQKSSTCVDDLRVGPESGSERGYRKGLIDGTSLAAARGADSSEGQKKVSMMLLVFAAIFTCVIEGREGSIRLRQPGNPHRADAIPPVPQVSSEVTTVKRTSFAALTALTILSAAFLVSPSATPTVLLSRMQSSLSTRMWRRSSSRIASNATDRAKPRRCLS